MKIVFLNPATDTDYSYPHMGMAFLSSILTKAGHQVACFDGSAPYRLHRNENLLDECKEINPDVICVTTTTERVRFAYHLLYLLRNHFSTSPIIVGGPHASTRPVEMVAHGFDIAVVGYSESRICELVEIAANRDIPRLEKLSGVAFQEPSGEIRWIPLGSDEDAFDINSLLPVDFSCFDLKDYVRKNSDRYRLGLLLAGRGCPGRCTYCSQAVFGRKLKISSPDKIIEDIINRKRRFGVRNYVFYDDTLLRNKDIVNDLCSKIVSTSELSDITWCCNARPNILDRQLLQNMKEAGCRGIAFGVENGNRETLLKIKKGIQLETMLNCIDTVISVGISVQVNLMNGFPWDNIESARINADFVKNLIDKGVSSISPTHTVFPYPGTELYEETFGKGYQIYNWWLRDDFFEKLNARSLYRNEDSIPYYKKLVPPSPKIDTKEDFYGVYQNEEFKKEIEKMLILIQKYNQGGKHSKFLKYKAMRWLVTIFGSTLYHISAKIEKWFWNKLLFSRIFNK